MPDARRTSAPGSGGTKISGSTRVVRTSATSLVCAGKHAVLDEEHVGVEARALVAGADLIHDARDHDRVAARKLALADDHVVELHVLLGLERDRERQRRRVLGADDATHDGVELTFKSCFFRHEMSPSERRLNSVRNA